MESVLLDTSLPGLRALRSTTNTPHHGVKEHYVVGRVESGRSEWWARGKVWESRPGTIHVKEPGDVHRDIALDGPVVFTIVVLPPNEIARVREAGKVVSASQLEPRDDRGAPFHRLHDAVCAGADRLTLEVALAEAISAFSLISRANVDHTRPVRRAMELLRSRMAEAVSLDDLAAYAGLDKFHLCRAFRAQIGMPPHTYLTRLRIMRAKELLGAGVRASEVAPLVGLYDQAQLTRHFRRIVGTTPARYQVDRSDRGGVVAGRG